MSATFVPMFSPYVIDEDDISHRCVKLSEEEKQKNLASSIDVTKALMLLGFSSWTALEPGENINLYPTNRF